MEHYLRCRSLVARARPEGPWYDGLVPYNATRAARLYLARLRGKHLESEMRQMLRSVGGVCPRCLSAGQQMEPDHIVPIYLGGSDSMQNLQPLCRPCNRSKRSESIDWLAVRGLRGTP